MSQGPRTSVFWPDRLFGTLGILAGLWAIASAGPMFLAGFVEEEFWPWVPMLFGAALAIGFLLVSGGRRLNAGQRSGLVVLSIAALLTPFAIHYTRGFHFQHYPFVRSHHEFAVATIVLAYCAARLIDFGPRPT